MPKAKTYGQMRVTDEEYRIARDISFEIGGDEGECAYQLVRYCDGKMHIIEQAQRGLDRIRGY